MNDPFFTSMKAQMNPSAQAQGELMDKLSQVVPEKRKISWKRYVAVAVCAALALCIYPAYRAMKPIPAPVRHSYVTVEGYDALAKKEIATITGNGDDEGGRGDQDQAMTPEELTEAMEEVGYSTADIDAYQALGYEMTWAKWWKFVNEQKNVEGEEPFNLASLQAFSQKELFVNTGLIDELPGGAYVSDDPVAGVPAQPGVDAYQLLMDHFGDTLPDWYGGAYITSRGTLMVLLVADKDPGDKTLELEVVDAVGRTTPVGFTDVKYSRNDLLRMNGEIGDLLDGKGIFACWGIYDDQNRIVLDFSETPPEEILTALAELDPDGDAILVRVIEGNAAATDQIMKGPALEPGGVQEVPPHKGSADEEEREEPASYSADPNAPAPDDEDLEAIEPWANDQPGTNEDPAPETEQSAHYDLLPLDPKGKE